MNQPLDREVAELHVYAVAPHGCQIARDTAIYRQGRHDVEEWFFRQRRAVNHEGETA